MLYLLNSIPNSLWNEVLQVEVLSLEDVRVLLAEGFTSAIGHESFAQVVSAQVGVEVSIDRMTVVPDWDSGDEILAAIVTPSRRLAEGDKWSSEELVSMPIKWVCVYRP